MGAERLVMRSRARRAKKLGRKKNAMSGKRRNVASVVWVGSASMPDFDVRFGRAMRSFSWWRKRDSSCSTGAFFSMNDRYALMSALSAGVKLRMALLYDARA
jgi:hypothetical protein